MTIAITIGRAVGRTAATTVHGACVAASYTGQFGKDLVGGTVDGYAEHSARLAAIRAAAPRTTSIKIEVKRPVAKRATARA